jgi:hypothetical protein
LQSCLSVVRPEDGSDDMLTDAAEYFAPYFRPVSVAQMVAGGQPRRAPRRTFYALGSLGQAVFVLPERDLVIARTGLDHTPDHNRLISAVLTALPLCEVSR